MGNPNDDSYKDLMDIIHKILGNQIPGKDGVPPIVGVKFVVGGGPQNAASPSRLIPVEVFECETSFTIQTELPGECPNDFTLSYTNGKLQLLAGENREYRAELPLAGIDPSSIKTRLKNGVLEIFCGKVPAVPAEAE